MRKTYLITATLLLSAVWAVAQSTPSSPSSPQSTTPGASSPSSMPQSSAPDSSTSTTQTTTTSSQTSTDTSIEGCLSGSSGNFTLTDQSGKAWQLAGDTSKLTEHVGHQVRVMGSDASASAAGASSGAASASGGSGGASGSTFTVKKVKMLSSSCPTSK